MSGHVIDETLLFRVGASSPWLASEGQDIESWLTMPKMTMKRISKRQHPIRTNGGNSGIRPVNEKIEKDPISFDDSAVVLDSNQRRKHEKHTTQISARTIL